MRTEHRDEQCAEGELEPAALPSLAGEAGRGEKQNLGSLASRTVGRTSPHTAMGEYSMSVKQKRLVSPFLSH